MTRARSRFRAACGAVALALFLVAGSVKSDAAEAATRGSGAAADAAALYNAGTDALERGDLGPAVAFLRAAQRIDPRAADVGRNLAEAQGRVVSGRGSAEASPPPPMGPLLLSSSEAWWLAASFLLVGAALALGGTLLRGHDGGSRGGNPRAVSVASAILLVSGVLLGAALAARARLEAKQPEAVVVVPVLDVGPAPEERPRPPYLLGAGEEVRLGRRRGALVEVRIGGAAIGWAPRSGVWRVADAARYTPRLP